MGTPLAVVADGATRPEGLHMAVYVTCRHCLALVETAADAVGTTVSCPNCGRDLPVTPTPDAVEGIHAVDARQALPDVESVPLKEEPPPDHPSQPEPVVEVWTRCPACGRAMPPDAVQCTMCGYDTQTKRCERVGDWWDQPTGVGWRLAAGLVALPVLLQWLARIPHGRVPGPLPGWAVTVYSLIAVVLAVGLWMRSDTSRLAWMALVVVFAVIQWWAMLLRAPSGRTLGLVIVPELVVLTVWLVGWSLMTGRHATRLLVAIGAGLVGVGLVLGVVSHLIR